MDITRHNYEEYFILYIDNELNAAERKAVELFVQENPDLEEELIMLQQSVMRPDTHLEFAHKESLMKDTASQGPVNEGNYEEYFVLYGDGELTHEEKELVEQFVYKYPQYQTAFELIQQARLVPETMSFPHKAYLYRNEEDDNKVVPFGWWRMVAAAVVLLVVGSLGWYVSVKKDGDQSAVVVTKPKTEKQEPVVAQKENTPATPATIAEKETAPAAPTTVAEKETATSVKKAELIAEAKKALKTTGKIQKIIAAGSNKTQAPNVLLTTEQPLKTEEEPEADLRHLAVQPIASVVEPPKPVVVNVTPSQNDAASATALAAAMNEDLNNDKTYVLNTSVNKTPLRGFFRKVSRVVDKATSFEVSENERGGVRIANFELALK
jgi:hypothetical protein